MKSSPQMLKKRRPRRRRGRRRSSQRAALLALPPHMHLLAVPSQAMGRLTPLLLLPLLLQRPPSACWPSPPLLLCLVGRVKSVRRSVPPPPFAAFAFASAMAAVLCFSRTLEESGGDAETPPLAFVVAAEATSPTTVLLKRSGRRTLMTHSDGPLGENRPPSVGAADASATNNFCERSSLSAPFFSSAPPLASASSSSTSSASPPPSRSRSARWSAERCLPSTDSQCVAASVAERPQKQPSPREEKKRAISSSSFSSSPFASVTVGEVE